MNLINKLKLNISDIKLSVSGINHKWIENVDSKLNLSIRISKAYEW